MRLFRNARVFLASPGAGGIALASRCSAVGRRARRRTKRRNVIACSSRALRTKVWYSRSRITSSRMPARSASSRADAATGRCRCRTAPRAASRRSHRRARPACEFLQRVEQLELAALVALEPDDLAVALEGEDVGGDAVEEPAIVADDHRAAGKSSSASSSARSVSTSRSLVGSSSSSTLPPDLQHLGQVHAVALAARELPTFFCWSAPLKLKRPTIAARGRPRVADLDESRPPEISSHTVFLSSSASRDWST
jgi:hypothetical protein